MSSQARHEFHVPGDLGYAVVLNPNKRYRVQTTEVTRVSTGLTTSEDIYLFTHYVTEVE